ncbi:MAG: PQQ-dependent sugar dehydrogenase, partial [Chloroflexota bacterium]
MVPDQFTDDVVISGLNLPTSIEFAPNGSIFITEKSGLIKLFDSLTDTSPTLVADLRTQVYNFWDRGLLGLAVDPAYPAQPYIYALYSYDASIGGTAPRYGTPNTDGDPCEAPPDGPGVTDDGCVTSGRLTRLRLDANGVMTSQKVLLEDWCEQYATHSVGTVMFGADGKLYVGGGEGANFELVMDYGQMGGTVNNPATGQPYTKVNPCGDPPGVGVSPTLPTSMGGALRAQSPRRPRSQPTLLDGTIVRVNPDDGNSLSTNPMYWGARDENERRIVAYGLRNPFRFTMRPGTNELWIGDVGSWYNEEINRVTDVHNVVTNLGWPCYEGAAPYYQWDALDADACESLYAAGGQDVTAPYFEYQHENAVSSDDTCATQSGVVSGVAFEQGGTYPLRYRDALFFADYGRNCIWAMLRGANGLPDKTTIESFVKDAAGPVELQVGPDGQLYYVDMNGGKIHRVSYHGVNQPPIIVASANPTNGAAPL